MQAHKTDLDAPAGERWFPEETLFTDEIKEYWGDFGVSSEVDDLKAVLMRRPGEEVEDFDWNAVRFKEPIDPSDFGGSTMTWHGFIETTV
ncbi:hypothetical protein SDC9_212962 [bioreactor metagenome]|uniref:Uncharacterized protein n=1 Tax=bioreactor metagenome TaxID=1076179 RepID=A0A645K2A3_9ZZZZ